eukprot:Pgem_evm1s11180
MPSALSLYQVILKNEDKIHFDFESYNDNKAYEGYNLFQRKMFILHNATQAIDLVTELLKGVLADFEEFIYRF